MAHVRAFAAADADAVAAIMNESIDARDSTMRTEPLSGEAVLAAEEARTDREALLVLEEDHGVVGWGRLRRYSDRDGYRFTGETSVFLKRSALGRGLGTQLQQALLRHARALGYHHLVAKIFADNERSIRMHRRLGYELVGVQREIGHVNGVWQDVAILQYVFQTEDTYGDEPAHPSGD